MIEKVTRRFFTAAFLAQSMDRAEVPAWMFDRVFSTSWRIRTAPQDDFAVLDRWRNFFITQG
ncbi:hypothetical protein CIT31_32335 [Mesorhizobium wenxiniae]|uniref:Uncharacterized protein n=1 Tax=Mesorhizobium wenxiniae TaxID=2014805 RepID=A0A271K7L6_9HYPH|nr:hypothetical protein CIT31_32335 [Mesorhizobium wenxiniae]